MLTGLAERSEILRGLIEFVYPPLCAGCGEYSGNNQTICPICQARIDWYEEPIALTPVDFSRNEESAPLSFPLYAAGDYSGPLREAVIQFKFRGVTSVATVMAERIATQFGEKIERLGPFLLVPIPLHPGREYVRGYNQASLLAGALAERLEAAVDETLIVRVARKRTQAKLKRRQRASNIRGVFECVAEPPSAEQCERVILVDDVITSGQTVFEARRVLVANGYQVVGAISIAHGL